jgi:polysaccharide biosynthesis/export protein
MTDRNDVPVRQKNAAPARRNVAPALKPVIVFLFLAVLVTPLFPQQGDYRVGSKDLLEIKVLELPDLNGERRVSDAGSIDLPMIGQFSVSGKTETEIRAQLEELLRTKYVNRANVTVVVKEHANKPISVLGAVSRPGSLNISGRYTLLQAIAAAGGLDQTAGKKIFIIRRADNGLTDTLEIRREDLLQSSSSLWNIPIYPSDVVNIPARSTVTVSCLGEVKSPGALQFDSDDRLTLLSVIAKAGGLTDRASKNILIKRRGADGKDTEMRVNYRAVISGKEPDPQLKGDDVVIVQESFL